MSDSSVSASAPVPLIIAAEWWPSITMNADGVMTLSVTEQHEGDQSVIVNAPVGEIPLFVRAGAVFPLLPADVRTLSPYGADDIVGLDDREDRRMLLAFPDADWSGPLGAGETITSVVTDDRWTLHFDAMSDRTYAVQASLAGLPEAFTPCSVSVANADVEFAFDETTRVLTTTADVAALGRLVVAACAEP